MRRQIVLLTIAATTVVALAFVVPLAIVVRNLIETRAINDADRRAQSLATIVATTSADRLELALGAIDNQRGVTVSLYLPDGQVIGEPTPAPDDASLALARSGRAFTQEQSSGVAVFVPVVTGEGGVSVIREYVPPSVLHHHLNAVWAFLMVLGVGLVGVSALIADRSARSMTRPLDDASRAARALAQGDLSQRAPVHGTAEVRAVGHALNELADRIEGLLQEERESLAELSHGLRTPLTALRLEVEHLGADTGAASDAVDRVERAVTQLIERARAPKREASLSDLTSTVRDRVAFWAVLARSQGRKLTTHIAAVPLTVAASRSDVTAALDAVIGNVFDHTPGGTPLSIDTFAEADQAVLIVQDEGSGFSPRAAVRGARGANSRGSGLGLDIARRIAERSGGELTVGRGPDGGARVTMRFGLAISSEA